MSVNTGGFFFSNPTPLPAGPKSNREDENVSGNNGGVNPSGITMPSNFNGTNLTHVVNQGNYINPNLNGSTIAMGNAVSNSLGNTNVNMGQSLNNTGLIANPHTVMMNNSAAAATASAVQNHTPGFGSFVFNPLAHLFSTNNTVNTQANGNVAHPNALLGSSVAANPMLNVNTTGNNNANSNISAANAMLSQNFMAVYQQQNPGAQVNMAAPGAAQALPINQSFPNNQFATTSPSPMPMAFMTPKQGPTPCSTPPLPAKSPMFLDAQSFSPEDVDALTGASNNAGLPVANQALQATQGTNVATQQIAAQEMGQGSTSIFRRGITSMGSALGAVATYVNQSLLSGIPFHIADRAMKESKETYAKWWEDGINDKKRKGSTDVEDNLDDSDEETNVGSGRKKRRLEFNSASGSELSALLKKHYDDMGIDTSSKFVEYEHQQQEHQQHQQHQPQQQQHQQLPQAAMIVQSQPTDLEVDSSIIKPRRSQFEHRKPSSATDQPAEPSGYDAFNHFGGMYDFGVSSGTDGAPDEGARQPLTYDSMGSYYASNEGIDASADVAEEPPPPRNATTRNNTLDGTMQVIQELLEEKNRASEENEILQMIASPRDWIKKSIRSELIDALQAVHGDVTDKRFLSSLDILSNFYKTSGRDARVSPWTGRRRNDSGTDGGEYGYSGREIGGPLSSDLLEGNWVNMSRPNYVECLGTNSDDEFLYTLGRMSFDMFQPGHLICSVQSTHNTIKLVGEREELPAFVPKSLREEVASLCDLSGDDTANRPLLRSYE